MTVDLPDNLGLQVILVVFGLLTIVAFSIGFFLERDRYFKAAVLAIVVFSAIEVAVSVFDALSVLRRNEACAGAAAAAARSASDRVERATR